MCMCPGVPMKVNPGTCTDTGFGAVTTRERGGPCPAGGVIVTVHFTVSEALAESFQYHCVGLVAGIASTSVVCEWLQCARCAYSLICPL